MSFSVSSSFTLRLRTMVNDDERKVCRIIPIPRWTKQLDFAKQIIAQKMKKSKLVFHAVIYKPNASIVFACDGKTFAQVERFRDDITTLDAARQHPFKMLGQECYLFHCEITHLLTEMKPQTATAKKVTKKKSTAKKTTMKKKSTAKKSTAQKQSPKRNVKTAKKTQQQTSKKYNGRPSPPFHAGAHPGELKKGNNGRLYGSVADKNGVYRWKLL
jgi:hypothetical protein